MPDTELRTQVAQHHQRSWSKDGPFAYAEITCQQCKQPAFRRRKNKYCSRACADLDKRVHKDGYHTCPKCRKRLPATNEFFYNNACTQDGLDSECKECKRAGRRKEFIASQGSKCGQCSLSHPDHGFFDIDHIIPLAVSKKRRVVETKFSTQTHQVLCPNCHRIKTMEERRNGCFQR